MVGQTPDSIPVVQLSIPVENDQTRYSFDFLERFQEYLRVGDSIFEDNNTIDDNSAIQNVINETANTTYENITVPLDQKDPNTTLSEWDVISSGNSPNKFSTVESEQQQQLSDIREEEQKSSSGISSSNSSSSFRSNRSVTPAIAYSQHWGIPELKINHRFMAAVVQDATDPDRFSVSIPKQIHPRVFPFVWFF